jgi:hypothetical protein
LRDLHEAAGEQGGPSTAKKVVLQVGTNAIAAGGQYLGLGFSPEVSAIVHPAVTAATDAVMPMLGRSFSSNPVKGALSDAYPALTGWRNAPNTPTPARLAANQNTSGREDVTPGWYGPYFSGQ